MPSQLDPQVHRLLFERVTSFEQLETLLLLQRTEQQAWNAGQVAETLRLEPAAAAASLAQLAGQGLLQVEATSSALQYRFGPVGEELAQAAARLAALHAEHPLEIIQQMSANAIERLRSSAARAFSDAFVFRNRKE